MANHDQFEKIQKIIEKSAPEACQACGGNLNLEKVNLEDYQNEKLYLMEKVPAMVCEECGETWIPEEVMLEFEKMIETAKQHGKTQKKDKLKTTGKIHKRKKRK